MDHGLANTGCSMRVGMAWNIFVLALTCARNVYTVRNFESHGSLNEMYGKLALLVIFSMLVLNKIALVVILIWFKRRVLENQDNADYLHLPDGPRNAKEPAISTVDIL